MQNNYKINILKTNKEINTIRDIWLQLQKHPNSDIDHYLTIVAIRKEVICPYVITIYEDDMPKAIIAGRIEDIPFEVSFGYKTILKPIVRHLTIIYMGILGEINEELGKEIIKTLQESLRSNEAEIINFRFLPMESVLFNSAKTVPSSILRDYIINPSLHWQIKIANSYDEYFSQLSRRTRSNFKNYSNRLIKKYGEDLDIKIYEDSDDLNTILNHLEAIAQKTYHRQLGAGFINNEETKKRFQLGFEKKWLKIYLLHINEQPIAYWVCWKYQNTIFTDYTGYNPEYNNLRVGNFVLLKLIEDACLDESINTIDFGFGDAQYKKILSNHKWEESSIYIFSFSLKNIFLNLFRTFISKIQSTAQSVLIKTDLLDKVKKKWRQKKVETKK